MKEVFLAMLRHPPPTVKAIADVMRVSQPLTFADAQVCTVEPPPGFEILTTAMAERCAITIIYESGWQQPMLRMITPRLVLEVHGGVCNRALPYERCGADLSVGSHPGVLAGIAGAGSGTKIIEDERMGTPSMV